ncbi:rhodanese-like domain-containing protein [Asticcacaulis sp. EMRT-3]|uniref:rhodanese-like domain-containing protein n=1 Tax=Asticcacaulis sp. EMRT-3 TaxID=3040349 RepID=UPI0024AF42BD|nr:rhodanese-like domain-containing protein [Asticcacaulis sp. EMRT-3]MDI7775085.1 rhodanese-like domain-containing protein [Asticcacaulis sp. EMRT-3]
MFNMFTVKNLSPAEVKAGLDQGGIVLVDVREPSEHNAERIKGAINVPLSKLDSAKLPDAEGKMLVMQCAGGVRSAKAVGICRKRGLKVDHHLAGGIGAWKASGLPTVR